MPKGIVIKLTTLNFPNTLNYFFVIYVSDLQKKNKKQPSNELDLGEDTQ